MPTKQEPISPPDDILIVDDTIANLRLLSDILSNAGYRVRPAERPKAAIDSALAHPPSLILLDVKMPGMDGFEVCRLLKQDARTRDVPILFVSALQDASDRVQGFDAGGVDFISKPFQALEVLARVKTHLQLRHMQLHLEDLVTERTAELVQANTAVRQSENRFRATFEQAAVGIAHVSPEGKFLRINQKFCDILGYTHEEMLQGFFQDITHEDDLDGDLALVCKLLVGEEESYSLEKRYIRKTGEIVWVHLTVSLVRKDTGEPLWFVSVVEDITERKALQKTVSEMASFAELNPAPVLRVNAQGHIVSCNPASVEILGAQGALGASIRDILPECTEAVLKKCLDGDLLDTQEADIQGRHYHFALRGIKAMGLVYFYGSDITKRTHAETQLRESEEKFRRLIEQSPIAIQIHGPDGRLQQSNAAYARLYALNPETLAGLYEKYNVLDDEQALKKGLMPFVKKAFRGEVVRFPLYEYDGVDTLRTLDIDNPVSRCCWMETQGFPIQDSHGEVLNVVFMSEDITERLKAQEDLHQLREELLHTSRKETMGELSSAIAHELNQPLTSIMSNAQAAQRFLDRDPPPLSKIKEILSDIVKNDRRAGDIIRKLRMLLKKDTSEFSAVSINELINEVLIFTHSNSVIKNVEIETELAQDLSPILGDRTQLQQVLLNLILNALDSFADTTKDGRQIVITTRCENEKEIYFSVRDSGCGIDESVLNNLFNPFVTTKEEGMGMGLAINRTIIQAHGGRIWAENNPDGGSIFNVVLPIKREEIT